MRKFFLPGVILLTILVFAGGVFISSKNNPSPSPVPSIKLPTNYEYFWGDGCPHCAKVSEFLDSWDKKDKINIEKFEVWKSKENSDMMLSRAAYCGIKPSQVGVPLLFTPEGKCLTGDADVINFFKSLP